MLALTAGHVVGTARTIDTHRAVFGLDLWREAGRVVLARDPQASPEQADWDVAFIEGDHVSRPHLVTSVFELPEDPWTVTLLASVQAGHGGIITGDIQGALLVQGRPGQCGWRACWDFRSDGIPLRRGDSGSLGIDYAGFDFAIDVIGVYTPAVDTWTYTYDATGLRTAKQEQGQTAFQFSWNTAGGLPLLLSQHIGTAATSIVYGPGGTPLYQVNPDGSLLYLHQDHQGSTRLVTNSSGNVHGRITYNAYGETISDTTPWFLPRPPLGYTGQYVDGETGFVFLRARYLDATTGQFTSIDPLEGWTRQPYSYGSGNPVSLSDPSGLWPWDGKCVMGVNCPEDARPVTDLCNTLVYDDCESVAEQHPEATQRVVDVSGGVLDTNPITSWLPLDLEGHGVRTDSNWHQAGRFGMIAFSTVMGFGANPAIANANTIASAIYTGSVCVNVRDGSCGVAIFGMLMAGVAFAGHPSFLDSRVFAACYNVISAVILGAPIEDDW